jgi:hypothetical protein
MGHLQLHAFAADHRPVLAPVELEGLAGREHQRHEGAAAGGLGNLMLALSPRTGKRRHTAVRAVEAQRHQVSLHLQQRVLLLAALALLGLEPLRQLMGERVELAGARALGVPVLHDP